MEEHAAGSSPPWLMLVHQLPPEPPALRVRVWRRLQALGTLQLKNSVYLLPENEATLEDFEWLVEEIRSSGGEATLWRGALLDGASDAELIAQFQEAVGAEYEALENEARTLDRLPDALEQSDLLPIPEELTRA